MRNISAGLSAHLAGSVQTIATLWLVTLKNGTQLAFTNHDEDITLDNVRYASAQSYSATDVASSATLEVDNLDLEGMLVSPSITEADLRAGLWDYATIRISIVNFKDLTMGALIQRVGHLGEVTLDRGSFKAELRGLVQAYSTSIIELTSVACRAVLGDSRCGVNLTGSPNYTVSGSVTAVGSDNATITDSSRTESYHPSGTGYFTGGKLTWTSGLNIGLSMEVREYVPNVGSPPGSPMVASGGLLILGLAMPYAIAPGDTFTVVPGCPKLLVDCAGTFNNVVNFRGEPHLRGNDALAQVGRGGA